MGECCSQYTPTDNTPRTEKQRSDSGKRKAKLSTTKSDKNNKSAPRHQLIPNNNSSGSQPSTPNNNNTNNNDNPNDDEELIEFPLTIETPNDNEYEDEEIDISLFQEDVIEFIEFWHQHFDTLTKPSIHNALVSRIHHKVKEQYESFPRETVDEFIKTLPELLETLETLLNIAIDGDIEDAISMYNEYQTYLINPSRHNTNSHPSPMPNNNDIELMDNKRKSRHRKQDSFSIKLTPAYNYDNETDIIINPCKLPVPPSPSHSRSKSKSRTRTRTRSRSNNKNKSDIILTDKDGIDLDDIQTTKHTFNSKNKMKNKNNNRLKPPHTPSNDASADEEAYTLFMGIQKQVSYEEDERDEEQDEQENIVDTDNENDDASVPLKHNTNVNFDIEIEDKFEMETADDAEVIMVGIMRILWFDRVSKYIVKYGLDKEINHFDLFFILSNALETAVGTFREYKSMMESFHLYIRQGLRTTLELIRAIINDLPLKTVTDRLEEIYDDPYSILIHFADRCDCAIEFWNENITTLSHDIKLQLSMRVYSYAILGVNTKTYDALKQNGAIVRWSALLLDFMETIIRFFTRNRHQDLIEYLYILALHHEKMQIPSNILGNMGEWLDNVFISYFDEEIYNSTHSDAIQFVFAFVGEVMSGAYQKPMTDNDSSNINNTMDVADQINENIPDSASSISAATTQQSHILQQSKNMSADFQIPLSFKSVVQIPKEYDNDDEDFTIDNYQNTIPKNTYGHMPQSSYTFNIPKSINNSSTYGPVSMQSNKGAICQLDLDGHENLNDMFTYDKKHEPVSSTRSATGGATWQTMKPTPTLTHTPAEGTGADMIDEKGIQNMDNLKPPIHSISQYLTGNSPLSQLDSPTISPLPTFNHPNMTPNEASYDADVMEHEQKMHLENKNRRRNKKRSFSHADNYVISKFLAPKSQNNIYTNKNNKKIKRNSNHALQRKVSASKTSSSMLLDPQQEKTWKPMHFLQKIMDLEGRKIISNYAFAPSDGSLNEKIVDLSIFHQYFETAQQFWSRNIDINNKTINKINDKLLNVFSERITDTIRYKISDLFAEKQINFVQMFSLYFRLVGQYLEKCKLKANGGIGNIINPALLNATNNNNNMNALPNAMTPSLRNKPKSSNINKSVIHKRTFSQRNSMSLGLSKFKLRSETTRDINLKHSHISHHNHFHSEGQFFVREMLRIGRKHRSHNIEEKTLKLVAKCLIEVIEKQFSKRFNDKTKRAFTIALKLGIKFMCVEPGKKTDSNNQIKYRNDNKNKYKKSKSMKKVKTKQKKKSNGETKPPVFRAKSAQTNYGGGFVD